MISDKPVYVRKTKKLVPSAIAGFPDQVQEAFEYVECPPVVEPPKLDELLGGVKISKKQADLIKK